MSDIQDAVDDVQDMFDAIEAEPDVRFLLGAGDLAQNGGRDELLRIQRELQEFDLPYYTTLGNHDIRETGAWQDLFGRGSTSFVFRGVRFTLLDSAAATIEPKVYEWLDAWLDDGAGMTHVVGMHIPPLDPVGLRNGGFGSRHEAGKLVAKLAAGNVDLTVYGHIHSYYRFDNASIPPSSPAAAGRFRSGWTASADTSPSSSSGTTTGSSAPAPWRCSDAPPSPLRASLFSAEGSTREGGCRRRRRRMDETVTAWASLAMVLATFTLIGCTEPTSHRNPSRFASLPAAKTLLTAAVRCGESHEVAAGGMLVKRATDFGAMAVVRLDARIERLGPSAPAIPRRHCAALLDDGAMHPSAWNSPEMPEILRELVHLSGADSVLVPVVTAEYQCVRGGNQPWIWGEPAYASDRGRVDCHESELSLIGYLFAEDGTVLWKGVHRYDLTEAPDLGKLVEILVRQAPVGAPAPLKGG